MALLKVLTAASRRGRRAVARLESRGRRVLDPAVVGRAAALVKDVRRRGDRAIRRAVRRFDGIEIAEARELLLPLSPPEAPLPAGFEEALERAIAGVERYHRAQLHDGFRLTEGGVELIERRLPLRRVGLYVPGGRASYPSSVVMTAVPARLAGVEEIVVATPPAGWSERPALRWTLRRLEIEEVWGIGGAHAIAALAYGSESLQRVDKIVGPGNAWVTAAKHLVSADVGIDGLAGPSEVIVVADDDADDALVAADLLAQAEHDPVALPLLVTTSRVLARRVVRQLGLQLPALASAKTARQALANAGVVLVVDSMDEAHQLVERLAPEHLQLVGRGAEALADRVRSAGAVFIGASTPEVFGDYLAGPSHVLPTAGSARYASGLGVDDFVRRSHTVRYTPEAARRSASAAAILAEVEGLPAHAAAARLRRREPPP